MVSTPAKATESNDALSLASLATSLAAIADGKFNSFVLRMKLTF
jgi:hypothetical protein